MNGFKTKMRGAIYKDLFKFLIVLVIFFVLGLNYSKVKTSIYKFTKGKVIIDSADEYVDEEIELPDLEEEVLTNDELSNDNRLQIEIGKKKFYATLYDNETAKELLKMLPLETNMQDLSGREKFAILQDDFKTLNHTKIDLIRQGDIMVYKHDRLAIFYKAFETEEEYTKVGYIDDVSGLEKALSGKDVDVIITVVK